MKRSGMFKALLAGWIAAAVLLGPAAGTAHAYIDTGTGSSLFSVLALAVGVASACVGICYAQIKQWGGWLAGRLSTRRKEDQNVTESVEE